MQGDAAERRAERLLSRAGLRLITRNFRCRGGELDLVMLDGETLVVVEVRARSHRGYAGAAESVDARKQARIVTATGMFVASHPQHAQRPIRFDVVAYDGDAPAQWLQAAFDAG
ncbi:MAG: YraN family protein [Nevskiales bacterium]|nr:YraN family protein [Nevskiales bacterium]